VPNLGRFILFDGEWDCFLHSRLPGEGTRMLMAQALRGQAAREAVSWARLEWFRGYKQWRRWKQPGDEYEKVRGRGTATSLGHTDHAGGRLFPEAEVFGFQCSDACCVGFPQVLRSKEKRARRSTVRRALQQFVVDGTESKVTQFWCDLA
jgi:hypothetical protein